MAKEDKSNVEMNTAPSEGAKTISNKDMERMKAGLGEAEMAKKLNKMSPSELAPYMRRMKGMAGEENKPDADGYRAGGIVNIKNFKGSF